MAFCVRQPGAVPPFEFSNVLVAGGEPGGGRIDFVRLPTGAWTVRGWTMRVPLASSRFRSPERSAVLRLNSPRRIKEVGGSVVGTWAARSPADAP